VNTVDKGAIKKFAVWARKELMERVEQKAHQYGMTETNILERGADSVDGRLLSSAEKKLRDDLVGMVKKEGYRKIIEEVAYTWFNRFCALRFMEVNGYLPDMVRVFTNDAGEFKPQLLTEAIHLELDGLDRNRVFALKEANNDEELCKYLLITQCNALGSILPGLFERIDDPYQLLFPDHLLREGSVAWRLVNDIPEEDWKDQVQIIGWLYQYYNTEPKDKVFADLKKNIKVTKENIPAATQLFTPDWIVRYMVENSLGRLWLEGHPNDNLKTNWKYYLEEAEQEENVKAELEKIRDQYCQLSPEDIKVIDPCMGSGHILAYLFDVLMQIYTNYGYSTRDAVANIVTKNLHGLDIDERATQLAYFSVMMKARQYDPNFFSRGLQPMVYCTKGDPEGEEYGSLLLCDDPGPEPEQYDLFGGNLDSWRYRKLLSRKYHVVVTNPPYMGASNMNSKLSDFIKANYTDYKSDFFSAFFVRCSQMALPTGKLGFFSPYVWMFIQSYEKLRHFLCQQKTIETLIQFEYSAFEEATVPVCTFAFSNYHVNKKGCYFRLTDFRGGMELQRQKTLEAIANHDCGYYYEQSTDNFSQIPGSPVAYWASQKALLAYKEPNMDSVAQPRHGLATSDNDRFLKLWHEIDINKGSLQIRCQKEKKWFPMSKGGSFRRWYGNLEWVINYENDGKEIKDFAISIYKCSSRTIQNTQFYFQEGLTWSALTSGGFSVRWQEEGALFGSGGYCAFVKDDLRLYVLALLNSKVTGAYAQFVSPTLNYEVGHIKTIPVVVTSADEIVTDLAVQNISLSRTDWNSFETSWDFTRHPLVRGASTVAEAYVAWERECDERFNQLKANEEELNRIFIDIYGLQGELTPEVEDKDVTVRKADLGRDIRSLISYVVGCMFGRYSLDVDGLAYAGGDWDNSKYKTFLPDGDNVIPICDDEYFNDDIVGRFVRWVETVYGKATLEENLKFIADALGGKGTPREVIRGYFLNDFYADHLKIYQKRPIYWLFDSGKKGGFKALIYMHRYQPDLLARMRTDYVHEQQSRYRTAIESARQQMEGATGSERVRLNKQLDKLTAQTAEIRDFEEKLHHLADQMIAIDLDDGVKVNYAKFEGVLAKIK